MNKVIANITDALQLLGIDLEDHNFKDTPERFAKLLVEYTQPFDAEEILKATFPMAAAYRGMVVQSYIPYRALCAHHLVPVLGRAHIGYVPNKHVVGLSKITRLMHAVACSKPSLQESVCEETADLLMEHLEPAGVIVVAQAEHGCMACRGIREDGVVTSTSSIRGVFRDVPQARNEFFQLLASRKDL